MIYMIYITYAIYTICMICMALQPSYFRSLDMGSVPMRKRQGRPSLPPSLRCAEVAQADVSACVDQNVLRLEVSAMFCRRK